MEHDNTNPETATPAAPASRGSRRYSVALTICFSVEVEAEGIQEAIEAAHLCAVNDGYPETQREVVMDAETGDILHEDTL
jgi:hypothetical protein